MDNHNLDFLALLYITLPAERVDILLHGAAGRPDTREHGVHESVLPRRRVLQRAQPPPEPIRAQARRRVEWG